MVSVAYLLEAAGVFLVLKSSLTILQATVTEIAPTRRNT